MSDTTDRFDSLGRRVAAAQDRLRSSNGHAEIRARLLARAEQPARARLAWISAGALAVAAGLVLAFFAWPAVRPLTFEHDATGERGTVGAWLSAPPERGELLRFSDGSEIELRPRAQARVAELDRDIARVVLERGAADVRIQSGGDRHWRIDAGPYRVTVTGTAFVVGWDPQREAFELDLREGAVIVEGPRLDGARTVVAGQLVQIAAPEPTIVAHVEPRSPSDPAPVEPERVESTPPAPVEPPRTGRERARREPRAPSEPTVLTVPAWHELADRGSYRDALAAAESLGFATLCTSLPADQLLRLADVARFARKPKRAVEALAAVRSRWAGSEAAATAAFERGRIALDGGAHGTAATWFETYLREREHGALAREAMGRLVEALDGAGRSEAARGAARRYLAAYPGGSHADLAARVLAGGG